MTIENDNRTLEKKFKITYDSAFVAQKKTFSSRLLKNVDPIEDQLW